VSVAPYDAIVPSVFLSIPQSIAADRQDDASFANVTSDKVVVGTTAVVTTSLSVTYVIWMLRGGSLLTAIISAMPAWIAFDPLPVLQSFDRRETETKADDSLLSLVTRQAAQAVKRVVQK